MPIPSVTVKSIHDSGTKLQFPAQSIQIRRLEANRTGSSLHIVFTHIHCSSSFSLKKKKFFCLCYCRGYQEKKITNPFPDVWKAPYNILCSWSVPQEVLDGSKKVDGLLAK